MTEFVMTIVIEDINPDLDEQMDIASAIYKALQEREGYDRITIYNQNGTTI